MNSGNKNILISVIIVQYNNFELTRAAIKSLLNFNKNVECILIDNASKGFNKEYFAEGFPELKIISLDNNSGFSKANNLGAEIASGEILLFLNNDTITIENYDKILYNLFEKDKNLGIVGLKLLNDDMTLQLSHGRLPDFFQEIIDKIKTFFFEKKVFPFYQLIKVLHSRTKVTQWVTGAALAIRKDLFKELGGFDENIFMYFEDKDLCKRCIEKGYKVLYSNQASIIHIRGGSTKDNSQKQKMNKIYRQSQKYYYKKHLNSFNRFLLDLYFKLRWPEL